MLNDHGADFSTMEYIVAGGAPLAETLQSEAIRRTKVPIVQGGVQIKEELIVIDEY